MPACAHEESRLTCVDCSKPICANCMVQCPVGFRCKSCVGPTKSPMANSDRLLLGRTFVICGVLGFVSAWLMPFIGLPYLTCIIWFVIGIFVGQQLAKTIDYRLRGRVNLFIVFGILFGMSVTPFASVIPLLSMNVGHVLASGGDVFEALLALVSFMFTPIAFIMGILRSTN